MLHLLHWISDYKHPRGYRIDRPRGNDMYTLLLFKQPVDIWQNGRMVRAKEYSCILYEKWAPQLYYNNSIDYYHDGVFFDGENPRGLLEELGIPINTVFEVQNPKAISNAIQGIGLEAMLKETFTEQILDLQLRTLIYKVADILRHGESYANSYYTRFQQLRNEVFRDSQHPWSAQELADELHISLSRFQHLYKEFFGTTLTQDMIQNRIEYAKYMLRSTDAPISAVSAGCGYNNSEHFMRQFRALTGVTPGTYRREYR